MKGITTHILFFRGCIVVAAFAAMQHTVLCLPTDLVVGQRDRTGGRVVVVQAHHSSLPLLPRLGDSLKKRLFDNNNSDNSSSNRRGGGPRFQPIKNKTNNDKTVVVANDDNDRNNKKLRNMFRITRSVPAATILVAMWTAFICAHYKPNTALACPSKLNAMAGFWFNVQSAFWSYCHIASLLVIMACLVAERCLIHPNMSVEDENHVVDIDLIFGLAGIVLVGSGFVRAIHYGQGGDYYIHDVVFWIKMTLAGIWGGLTLFPSIIFYRRKKERHDIDNDNINNNNGILGNFLSQQQQKQQQAPMSEALVQRLHKIVNAEISAIFFIPLLGSLMRRGVFYSPTFVTHPIIGIVTSITLTIASNVFYARKAFTWKEPAEKKS